MALPGFVAELRRRSPALYAAGVVFFALAALFVAASLFDTRTILGISPWIKPLKFALSIGIYLWTLGWLVAPLRAARPRAVRVISALAIATMAGEIVGIAGQSLRGETSHFNEVGALNAVVFALMGLLILLNTIAIGWLLWLYLSVETGLRRPYLLAVRLGLAFLLLGSFQGAYIIGNKAHSIGGRDGGPGLPLVNFSTTHGDLRPAHALGLHALQILPLFAFLLARYQVGSDGAQTALVAAFAAAYLGAFVLLFAGALAGKPLLALAGS